MENQSLPHIAISQFRKLFNLKVLEFDENIPMAHSAVCAVDEGEMTTLCRLTGSDTYYAIEIGCCKKCGYVGYIDKPTEKWISTLYAEAWDGVKDKKIDREVQKRKEKYSTITSNPEFERATMVLDRWQRYFPKEKFLCDMGCGYGMQLKLLWDRGFNKVIGCEASPHRAEVARRAFGVTVADGTFDHPAVQAELRKSAPLGLIYANNVLEHVHNPAEAIRLCANLQEDGDKLVIAVPNQTGEPTWCVLFYFLHLNSFTSYALETLLSRYGYTIIDSLNTPNEICVLAEKKKAAPVSRDEGIDFYKEARQKINSYFFPSRVRPVGKLFWCGRESDDSGYLPYFGDNLFTQLAENIRERMLKRAYRVRQKYQGIPDLPMKGNLLSFVVPASNMALDKTPFEIRFEGGVKMLYR